MISQLLYGEHFKVLEQRKLWSKIRGAYDGLEGWVANNQYEELPEETFRSIETRTEQDYAHDLVSFVDTDQLMPLPIVLGSTTGNCPILSSSHEGQATQIQDRDNLIPSALLYLNSPYLRGGRTPFGLDAAGFTQMVYKLNGFKLLRTAAEQAGQGIPLSFIEESEPGDLAFFDNKDGTIDHVGLIMENNHIIHVNGKVRIDRIDHTGIFNGELRQYTHQLRVIKKIVS